MKVKECKHRMSLKKKDRGCIEHDCHHYVSIRLRNAQTKEIIDQFMCDELAMLQINYDLGKAQTETGAAIESFRNAVLEQEAFMLLSPPKPTEKTPITHRKINDDNS